MKIRIKKRTLEQSLSLIVGSLLFVALFVGVTFTTDHVFSADNETNRTVIARVNVTNTEPNITSIVIDDSIPTPSGEIDLIADSEVVVTCNATVFDVNGWEDIVNVNKTNATLFISSVGSDAADDNNDHYTNSSCGRCVQATDATDPSRTAWCDCKFSLQYYANASDQWTCNFTVVDDGGNQISGLELNLTDTEFQNSVIVTKLLALDVPPILDYGNLSVTQTSSEIVHNVTNVGNIPFNLSLRGFGGTNDSVTNDNTTMMCEFGNISIGNQRFTTVSGTAFSSMNVLRNVTDLLVNFTDPDVNISWPARVDDSTFGPDRNSTYWRIQVPLGVGGICNGTIEFGAIDAEGSI